VGRNLLQQGSRDGIFQAKVDNRGSPVPWKKVVQNVRSLDNPLAHVHPYALGVAVGGLHIGG
jgi:hypothetical protein